MNRRLRCGTKFHSIEPGIRKLLGDSKSGNHNEEVGHWDLGAKGHKYHTIRDIKDHALELIPCEAVRIFNFDRSTLVHFPSWSFWTIQSSFVSFY